MAAITGMRRSVLDLIREPGVGQMLDFNTDAVFTLAGKPRKVSISWGEMGALKLQNWQEMMGLSLRDFLFNIP